MKSTLLSAVLLLAASVAPAVRAQPAGETKTCDAPRVYIVERGGGLFSSKTGARLEATDKAATYCRENDPAKGTCPRDHPNCVSSVDDIGPAKYKSDLISLRYRSKFLCTAECVR